MLSSAVSTRALPAFCTERQALANNQAIMGKKVYKEKKKTPKKQPTRDSFKTCGFPELGPTRARFSGCGGKQKADRLI